MLNRVLLCAANTPCVTATEWGSPKTEGVRWHKRNGKSHGVFQSVREPPSHPPSPWHYWWPFGPIYWQAECNPNEKDPTPLWVSFQMWCQSRERGADAGRYLQEASLGVGSEIHLWEKAKRTKDKGSQQHWRRIPSRALSHWRGNVAPPLGSLPVLPRPSLSNFLASSYCQNW